MLKRLFFKFEILFIFISIFSFSFGMELGTVNVGVVSYKIDEKVESIPSNRVDILLVLPTSDIITNEKTVDRASVEYGEEFEYKMTIKDTSNKRVEYYVLNDILPKGIEYVEGTLKISRTVPENEASNYEIKKVTLENGEKRIILKLKTPNSKNKEIEITYSSIAKKETALGINTSTLSTIGYAENQEVVRAEETSVDIDVKNKLESEIVIIRNEKISSRKQVKFGETFKYTIKIYDDSNENVSYYVLEDLIPSGIEYIDGTIKTSGNYKISKVKDSKSGKDRILLEVLNPSSANKEIEVNYLVKVGMAAKIGDNYSEVRTRGYNKEGMEIVRANIASVVVEIIADTFAQKGMIFGIVYLDKDNSGTFNSGDLGVPGIKIYLENGDYAITDEDGKYSIYGENAITHVAKMDISTAPKGAKTASLGNLYNKNGTSVFVPLKTEEAHKANFRFIKANDSFIEQVKQRVVKYKGLPNEIVGYLENKELKSINDNQKNINIKGNGVIGEKRMENTTIQFNSIEKYISTPVSNNIFLEFDDLKDGDIIDRQQNIRVITSLTVNSRLLINGKEVLSTNLGKEEITTDKKIHDYFALNFEKGTNEIVLEISDMFGNIRERKKRKVIAPDEYNHYKVEILERGNLENGQPIKIKVALYDKNDIQVKNRTEVELKSTTGKIVGDDTNLKKDGMQFFTEVDGTKTFTYFPNDGAKKLEFEGIIKDKKTQVQVPFNVEKREIFVNGIIEGRINFGKLGKEQINFGNYIFENSLEEINEKNNYTFSNRGAFFAKGDITDKYYMTISYDNNDEKEKFFAYRDPEDYFPIYGDNSIKGYEAESISRLYAKLEAENHFILYGDYETKEWQNSELELSSYNRVLNGGLFRYNDSKAQGMAFASKTATSNEQDEMPGEGISGPYNLSNRNIIAGTEIIDIVTYSRNNPTIVINTEALVSGVDYTIDYTTGRIFFSKPIPMTDHNFNPIFIRVSYEVEAESGAKKRWIYGGQVTFKSWEILSFGGTFIKDEDEFDGFELRGVHTSIEVGKNKVLVEQAETKSAESEIGRAYVIKHMYKNDKIESESKYSDADINFKNKSSIIGSGITSFEHLSTYELGDTSKLKLEATYIDDKEYKEKEKDIRLSKIFNLTSEFTAETGVRYYYEKNEEKASENSNDEFISLGASLTWHPIKYSNFMSFIEYEQDIEKLSQKRVGVGAKYKISERMNLYAHQEFFKNMGRDYAVQPNDEDNKTVVGIETSYGGIGKHFTEYRLKHDNGNTLPELANGLKRDFLPTKNLSIYTTFERVDYLGNSRRKNKTNEKSTKHSFTLGYKYNINSRSYTNGAFEMSLDESDTYLTKLGYGSKINESLSFVVRNRLFKESDKSSEQRYILGLAYRDYKNDKYNAFLKYEYLVDDGIAEDGYKRDVNLIKLAQNYQYSKNGIFTFSISGKYMKDKYEGVSENHLAYLIVTGVTHNVTEKIDLGLNLGVLTDHTFNEAKYSLGGEIGYQLPKDIWLSLGYNVMGFSDRELDVNGDYRGGVYLRFRMKLSEWT